MNGGVNEVVVGGSCGAGIVVEEGDKSVKPHFSAVMHFGTVPEVFPILAHKRGRFFFFFPSNFSFFSGLVCFDFYVILFLSVHRLRFDGPRDTHMIYLRGSTYN